MITRGPRYGDHDRTALSQPARPLDRHQFRANQDTDADAVDLRYRQVVLSGLEPRLFMKTSLLGKNRLGMEIDQPGAFRPQERNVQPRAVECGRAGANDSRRPEFIQPGNHRVVRGDDAIPSVLVEMGADAE